MEGRFCLDSIGSLYKQAKLSDLKKLRSPLLTRDPSSLPTCNHSYNPGNFARLHSDACTCHTCSVVIVHIMSKVVCRPSSHIKCLGHATIHGMHASLVILISEKGRGLFALHSQKRNSNTC